MYKIIFFKSFHPHLSFNLVFSFILLTTVISCKKEYSDSDTLQSKMGSGMVSYVQGSNVVALNGTNYNFTPFYIGIPITLKEKAKSDDEITAVVDPTLVAQYNQIYKEKNPEISAQAFRVAKKGVFSIGIGSLQAKDSLYVELNDGSGLRDSTVYLVPVTLSSKIGSNLTYSVFFFKVFVTKGELKSKMFGASVFNGATASRLRSGALTLFYTVVPDSLKFRVNINTFFPASDVSVQGVALTDAEVNAGITKEGFTGVPTPRPVPSGVFSLTKDLAMVPARALLSRDSLTLKFPNKGGMVRQQWYVMGIKLKAYTASPFGVPPVANDSARVYIRFFLSN
ncbi:hypothetical protein ASU31_00585 [Pedobacter ginsenosidimutans]|uniref:BT-3987-like N-terminal domain-containing protein n=1 Tax=Pedobacter ginsenosidimutans TaxID=687842 RepID=A0A0T5VVE5_9SPHI|nr:DUF1735 domain-containing protein [Pedobacter ginsenosidimutans]KRT17827.1 hypothetical protein ASU31_00585 [Pedobacter ginsenosidimutans]